jgi:hypothetical protein
MKSASETGSLVSTLAFDCGRKMETGFSAQWFPGFAGIRKGARHDAF